MYNKYLENYENHSALLTENNTLDITSTVLYMCTKKEVNFAVEFNMTLLAGEAKDRYVLLPNKTEKFKLFEYQWKFCWY